MHRKYANTTRRAEFLPEQRRAMLRRLQIASRECRPAYAVYAAGFWLDRQAPIGKRFTSKG